MLLSTMKGNRSGPIVEIMAISKRRGTIRVALNRIFSGDSDLVPYLLLQAERDAHTFFELPLPEDGSSPAHHSCPSCPKVFMSGTWKQKLERHILPHTGVNPFQCPHCPHRSNRKYNLRYHVVSMHKHTLDGE